MTLVMAPMPAVAAPPPLRLSDWWLAQETLPSPDTRPYYLLTAETGEQQRLGRRLLAELTTLIDQARLERTRIGHAGLMAWRQAAHRDLERGGRTPARADLTALLADPRHDPTLSSLASIGVCQAPDWVEIWSLEGVTRRPWTARMRLSDLLRELPAEAVGAAQATWLVSPHRSPRRLGIAAWNAEDAELIPGSRLVLELRDDLPAAAWLNRHLPDFLATRLPGESCTLLGPTVTAPQRKRST